MCGIFGIINKKPTKFNKTAFNILGINNDSRGGDSCGIFIDGEVEYGVNDKKLYSSFFKESNLINNTKKCTIALGHCRKASVGNISLATAQPVVLTDDDGNVEFVVIHNGTIHNYKELAAKYIPEVNILGLTDSQVMARIFYYKGYDVLAEYYGGAVFVIVDYRDEKPSVLVWKGASKAYTASQVMTEERPFYFIEKDGSFIFSSISTYLSVFSNEKVYTINANQLITIEDGDMHCVSAYDRKDVTQSSVYPRQTQMQIYSHYGYYENEREFEEDEWWNKQAKNNKEQTKTTQRVHVTDSGLYCIDEEPIHGEYCLDANGNIYTDSDNKSVMKLWFWDGVLLYGSIEYIYLVNACKRFHLSHEDVKYTFGEILNYLSPYPISHPEYRPESRINLAYKCKDGYVFEEYTGHVHRFLKGNKVYYSRGLATGTIWTGTKEDALNELKDLIKKKNVDIAQLYKELYQC